MGGFGSGRHGGRPTADASRRIDLAWMRRKGLVADGVMRSGILNWSCGGEPSGSISYRANMCEAGQERLVLEYTRENHGERGSVLQTIHLTSTRPNFGGKRWWMICPYHGHRVGKLNMPAGGDRFASRKAWRLGYHSQCVTDRDAIFERLFRIQKRLECEQGWGNYPSRPKGMHHRTFDRLREEFEYLDNMCAVEMMRTVGLLQGRL
ncbi:MAG: hypothetical protein AAF697_14295 [Pseudomonadota bacterium]